MLPSLPPALWFMAAALLIAVVRGKARPIIGIVFPIIALVHAWQVMDVPAGAGYSFLGYQVHPVVGHGPTGVFATIFCLMAVAGSIFGMNRDRPAELAGAMVYAGGALGVVFSGDWLSLFVFWEVMTLGSTTIIYSARHSYAQGAGLRYFALHAVGGVLLLAGIMGYLQHTGATDAALGPIGSLTPLIMDWQAGSLAAWLILVGMLVNAGATPFSAWIPDAYPAATETGTVWLSAYTTKTAVFTLLMAFAGTEVLLYFGMAMACYGILYAILENDVRRILAYAIVNQVGFMLVGIGVGTPLAVDGVTAHAFSHIIYKGLLLMAFGAVIQATGKHACSDLGGLARRMPLTMVCAAVGLLAMSSFPFTAGYTTKSMLTVAAHDQAAEFATHGHSYAAVMTAWWVLKVTGTAVFVFAGLKLLWFVFLARDRGLTPSEAPWNMRLPMLAFAAISLTLGVYPDPLYQLLPNWDGEAIVAYKFSHFVKFLVLLVVSAVTLVVVVPFLKCTNATLIDTDWFYRRLIPGIWRGLLLPLVRILGHLQTSVMEGLPRFFSQRLRSEGGLVGLGLHRDYALGVVVVLLVSILFIVILVGYFFA